MNIAKHNKYKFYLYSILDNCLILMIFLIREYTWQCENGLYVASDIKGRKSGHISTHYASICCKNVVDCAVSPNTRWVLIKSLIKMSSQVLIVNFCVSYGYVCFSDYQKCAWNLLIFWKIKCMMTYWWLEPSSIHIIYLDS